MARFAKNRDLRGFKPTQAILPPHGGSSLRPATPVNGLYRWNSDNNVMEIYYSGVWNSVAKEGTSTIAKNSFTGTGGTFTFTMSQSYTAGQEAQVLIFVGGVFQNPGVAYTFNGTTTLTFSSAPPLGQAVVVLHNFPSTVTA